MVLSTGLAGKNEMEEAKVDWIVDCGEDFMRPLMAFFYEKDEAKKVGGMNLYYYREQVY